MSLLNIKLDKSLQTSNWNKKTLSAQQLQYAATDAAIVLPLHETLIFLLEKANLFSTALDEFNCLQFVAQMELNGLKLDLEQWHSLGIELQQQQTLLSETISLQLELEPKPVQLSLLEEYAPQQTTSINLRSPQQVIAALKKIGISVNSTDASELILRAEKHPIIRNLLDYRSITTLMSTFIEGFPKYIHAISGRVHGHWFQMGTKSGRFSCHRANLTNIPKDTRFRRCFVATEGNVLIKADYSQIELRLMAKASGDLLMQLAYQKGEDLHKLTAAQLFNKPVAQITDSERYLGKIVNFGFIYGMGVKKFLVCTAFNYGIYLSAAEASRFRKTFFKTYTGIAAYHKKKRKRWQQGTRVSRTLDGRRRIWSLTSGPTLNELLNNPIQGTNAGILKRAIALLGGNLLEVYPSILLVAVIHDEIVLECPRDLAQNAAKILVRCMKQAAKPVLSPIPVQVDVKICKHWS
ncbi:DNA polymerase [Gloeothece verrucosa]|uniref:DNA polymerase n=1 Tax=Gloeothece verrucosa TaxID=2546359 RepID=UPI00017E2F5B|nr:DNA polymerase [Gloeothece verrucosa]